MLAGLVVALMIAIGVTYAWYTQKISETYVALGSVLIGLYIVNEGYASWFIALMIIGGSYIVCKNVLKNVFSGSVS